MLRPDQDIRHEGRTAPPVLRIAGVRAGYGGQSVLHEAGFTLHAGECAALLGPNGSGKTTLLRALSGVRSMQRNAPISRQAISAACTLGTSPLTIKPTITTRLSSA